MWKAQSLSQKGRADNIPVENWYQSLCTARSLRFVCASILVVVFLQLLVSWSSMFHHEAHETAPHSIVRSAAPADSKEEKPPSGLVACPEQPPGLLGNLSVVTDPAEAPSWQELEISLPYVKHGGCKPSKCDAQQLVAILIPYRKRDSHLRLLLSQLHPMLRRQQLNYRIFVIEQVGNNRFNRAMLFNIGFVEVGRIFPADCWILHDVDLIPENDHNIYRCGDLPRHMSAAVDTLNYILPTINTFGGVCAVTSKQFKAMNGFSNVFFGWGGEDDEFIRRLFMTGYKITRYPHSVARYKMIKHKRDVKNEPNPVRVYIIKQGAKRWKQDGLNSLDYSLVSRQDRGVAYFISVDIPESRVLKKFNLS